MSLEDIYKDAIMDHYARPRGRGKLEHPVIVYHAHNPTCGDEIEVQADVEDGRIKDVRFSGQGCSISQASASMMTVAMKGKTLAEAKATLAKFLAMMKGEPGAYKELGEVQALQGVSKLPVRLKCATLAWHALEVGLSQHEAGGSKQGPVRVLETKDF
ncbi:MAG: Fe-S cluster assembly sulfur transfer protein SufU [Bacillota bacterium]